MTSSADAAWLWEVADHAEEVHALLCVSDVVQAEKTGTPVPQRRFTTTERRVREGAVHLMRRAGTAVASFTLTSDAPFDAVEAGYEPTSNPFYLQRLAVHPDLLQQGSVVGAQSIRRAARLAIDSGADVLRAEVNPDLSATAELLELLGFVKVGPLWADGRGRRWMYVEKALQK